jgi:hypothetical protein
MHQRRYFHDPDEITNDLLNYGLKAFETLASIREIHA